MTATPNAPEVVPGLGTSEYSEKLIRPGANVGFFGWLALLGLPILILFFIYTKMDARSVVKASSSSALSTPVNIDSHEAKKMEPVSAIEAPHSNASKPTQQGAASSASHKEETVTKHETAPKQAAAHPAKPGSKKIAALTASKASHHKKPVAKKAHH